MDLIKAFWKSQQAINTDSYDKATVEFEAVLAEAQKHLPKSVEEKAYPRYAVRGGQAGCLVGGKILGNSPQSCPLKSYLRSWGIEEPKDERALYTFAMGTAQEKVFAELHPDFKMSVIGDRYEIEGIPIKGEVDAIAPDGTFYELKSVQSTQKLKGYLVDGEFSFDNFMQLAFYMSCYQKSKGVLRYTCGLYHKATINKVEHKFAPGMYREYKVAYDDSGRFYVDGKATLLTTESMYRHIEYIVWVFTQQPKCGEILVPVAPDALDKSLCCVYCYFREACDAARVSNSELSTLVDLAKSLKN